MGVGGQLHVPPLYPVNGILPNVQEAGWAPRQKLIRDRGTDFSVTESRQTLGPTQSVSCQTAIAIVFLWE